MSPPNPSLRLRPWASLVLFLSAYAPLLLILILKDYDQIDPTWLPQNPWLSGTLLFIAIFSSIATFLSIHELPNGLPVVVTKTANKSSDMFGYTTPYILSFLRIDLDDWRTVISLAIFFVVLFVMAYRTQTMFINPILALAGYMLIDCTFKRGKNEFQAMVITRNPLNIGKTYQISRLSHYLYVAATQKTVEGKEND